MSPRDQTGTNGATISLLPVRAPLDLMQSAAHLGVTPLRLRLLRWAGAGPASCRLPERRTAYRVEELDAYLTTLYRNADISLVELQRRRAAWRRRSDTVPHYPRNPLARSYRIDPFTEMATRMELVTSLTSSALRIAVLMGLAMIILSHTPLFWHFLRHGPYGDI